MNKEGAVSLSHDDVIARLLRRIVLKNFRLDAERIRIRVQDGDVFFTGFVRSEDDREAASDFARAIPGVMGISNNLKIVDVAKVADEVIAESIRQSLERHPLIIKESITVCVVSGVVTLSGAVSAEEERVHALETASIAPGVRDICDQLSVDSQRRAADSSFAHQVKAAICQRVDARRCNVRVAMSAGTLVLSGFVGNDAERRTADAVAREFAVQELRNEIQIRAGSTADDGEHLPFTFFIRHFTEE